MNITLKLLKNSGFEIEKDIETKGEYTCWHDDTNIQICRDADGTFWTDYCGMLTDLKNMSQVAKILILGKVLKKDDQ